MITKFDQFLNEGISEVIYHRTWLNPLVKILKSGKILLSTTIHSLANSYSKEAYYLSFSRTKNTNLGYLKGAQVVLEFDGKMLGTKYKGGPVDFNWVYLDSDTVPSGRHNADEYEERIYSNNPFLQNLDKYIKHIDVIIENERTDSTLREIKKINSPLTNKIRIFKTQNDFSYGKNWTLLSDYKLPDGEDTKSDNNERFDFNLLKDVITILLIGDKKIKDKEYVKNFFLKYINKFISLGADKLKDIDEHRLNSIVYEVQRTIEWINPNDNYDSFLNTLEGNIKQLSGTNSKNEISYRVLKLLSDEMVKYKVITIRDLVREKKGEKKQYTGTPEDSVRNWLKQKERLKENPDAKPEIKKEKIQDYSHLYGFVYKQYDRWILVNNNKENPYFLNWSKLDRKVTEKIYEMSSSETTVKIIINAIFNTYNVEKSKELIFAISDTDYKLIDLKDKMIYREITEKDYRGDDIGHRGAWNYLDKGNWVLFIQQNITEKKFKEIYGRILKLSDDDEVKLRFIWSITEKLLGTEKTNEFFDENNLVPREGGRGEKEVKYLLNIGEKRNNI